MNQNFNEFLDALGCESYEEFAKETHRLPRRDYLELVWGIKDGSMTY